MAWDHIAQRIFWGLMSGVAIYASTTIREMQHSMEELNLKFSTYIERVEFQRAVTADHEIRIRALEKR